MAKSDSVTGNECKTEIIKHTVYDSKSGKESYKFLCKALDEKKEDFKCPNKGHELSKQINVLADGTEVVLHRCKDTKAKLIETFQHPCTGSTLYDPELYKIPFYGKT